MPEDIFGDAVPPAQRIPRKRTFSDKDRRTLWERLHDCAHNPDLYELAETLPKPDRIGRPRDYPDLAFLFFLTARSVLASARRTAAHLEDPEVWTILESGVRAALGPAEAARLPEAGPTRSQWLHAQRRLRDHSHELWEAYRPLALQQALDQGIFPEDETRAWSNPQRHQLIAADGTVLKSPTLARAAQSVDLATGEIRCHRIDPASVTQTEGGGNQVFGPKYVFFSARKDADYMTRVFLDSRYVPHLHPGGEAAVAVDGVIDIMSAAPGCMGTLYDGAMRGVHRDTIARFGGLVINKQHKGNDPQFYETLRRGRCSHELWAANGRIAEKVHFADGTTELVPAPVRKLERRGTRIFRWYHVLTIPCRHGRHEYRVAVGTTSRTSERPPGQSDEERGFHRAEHLQQIPEFTRNHQLVYPYRSDAESGHAQLDASLWNGRLISYGVEAQQLLTLGFVLAQNSTSRALHQTGTVLQPTG
ncbi:hypothetical protein [Actinacidiphila oryziradicis]|uniref:Transposase n=1 Tax=Actinacidiphila oryziradicis TaxID=2571141 RepID=A0A4U0S1S6_9ACTN|nr:hypothetical protein [Actinacidiphila oryziradicis]TKA01947.1 hypothetical protein FCI23_39875 [Actinacidiphila oryziradicis]